MASNKNTSWGGVAEWYDELLEKNEDSYQARVILPNLLRLLDPKPGMRVLDIACGQGYFSRAYAAAGATVTGCDISAELISLAQTAQKAQKAAPRLSFKVAPADALTFAGDASADAATIILALQNIENLSGTLSEAARVLVPGGRLILVLNHPAFRIPQRSSWGWDEKNGEKSEGGGSAAGSQYRRLDAYMSEAQVKIDMTPGRGDAASKRFTVSFHRPLQVYFKALNKAGFSVSRLEEWISHKKSQAGPRGAEEDRMRKEIPLFLCLEAVKAQ